MPRVKEKTYYTYADYLAWEEDARYEIINGEAYMMAAPSRIHQEISMALSAMLYAYLEGKPRKVYAAPFSVRLFPTADLRDDTVVEPDIAVVCDLSKLDDRGCNGAPDFIIEIISPATVRQDRIIKFNKYLEAGVREYWIVDPGEKIVMAYTLKDGQYTAANYDDSGPAPVKLFPGCEIDLKALFAALR
jgi:Uma2 family endonuclease